MWRLLIGYLCIGHIVWADTSILTNAERPTNNILSNFGCPAMPVTCKDVESSTPRVKAVLNNGAEVLCDTETDNGGWTVIQRRINRDQSFYLNWGDYVSGFGKLDSDFWMGLRLMNEFTYKRCYELRVDLTYQGVSYYAQYSYFKVHASEDGYRLKIGNYSGNAGDALKHHDGQRFTTKDRDNDQYRGGNCASKYHGAWWYGSCHLSNLNGEWGSKEYGKGLNWKPLTGHRDSATFSEMKIRPCP